MEATETPRVMDAHRLRMVAVAASCDPRSVEKVLRGEPIRSSVAERITWAIGDLRRRGKLPGDAHHGAERGAS
jgi:hypothetical protein